MKLMSGRKGAFGMKYNVPDPINPSHYQRGGIEAFDVVDAFELTYHVGTSVAYLLRAGKKTADPREDISKAIRHLQRELQRLEASK